MRYNRRSGLYYFFHRLERRIVRKKAILACMLVVSMLLTGCALVEKDQAVDFGREVIRVSYPAGGDDIVYTKGQVLNNVEYQLNYMAYMYRRFGSSYDTTSATNIANTKDSVMDSLVKNSVKTLMAHSLKLDEFTDAELEEINSAADENWASLKDSLKAKEFADTELTAVLKQMGKLFIVEGQEEVADTTRLTLAALED